MEYMYEDTSFKWENVFYLYCIGDEVKKVMKAKMWGGTLGVCCSKHVIIDRKNESTSP